MNTKQKIWLQTARKLQAADERGRRVARTYAGLLGFVLENGWAGACHATSAVLAVLMRHQGIEADPCLGECRHDGAYFDHSWVEIDGAIYDVAIAIPLIGGFPGEPVFAGKVLGTAQPTPIEYGVVSGAGLDPDAITVQQTPFDDFMFSFPHHSEGLWGVAGVVSKKVGCPASAHELRAVHHGTEWLTRPPL